MMCELEQIKIIVIKFIMLSIVLADSVFAGNSEINGKLDKKLQKMESYQFKGELKDFCRSTNECRTHAYICSTKKQCECAQGYKPDHANSTCLGAIGQSCMYDNHCIRNAYCKGQTVCTCKIDYSFESYDKWSCLGDWESTGSTVQSPGRVMTAMLLSLYLIVVL